MNTLILILTILISFVGVFVSLQTIIETRNKYYKDYLNRKRNEEA